jgi:hypothetical protein
MCWNKIVGTKNSNLRSAQASKNCGEPDDDQSNNAQAESDSEK